MQGVPPPTASVLVVEDEPVTLALIEGWLRAAGHVVFGLDRAKGLLDFERIDDIDLVLLDIELPDGDGFSLARWVRERSEAGIIFLSRRCDPHDRVRGLDLGGDDFIVKPPDLDELLARVRAVLRRRQPSSLTHGASPPTPKPERITFEGWSFSPQDYNIVSESQNSTPLTPGEVCVLGQLLAAGGRVVPRDTLRASLSRCESSSSLRSLDVVIHRLRRKLGEGGSVVPRILLTVHGVGYRVGVDVTTTLA
jgi:two-component system torCAD operon response regulator TorR